MRSLLKSDKTPRGAGLPPADAPPRASWCFCCAVSRAPAEKAPEASAAKREASWRLVLANAKKAASKK